MAIFVVLNVLAPVRPASALDGPNITVGDVTVSEGDVGPAVITVPVDLSSASNSTVTVQYTVYGDPTGAGDVPTTTGKLTFRIGATERLIKVTVLGDTTLENNGTALIELSVPVHAQIVDGIGEVLVRDDDSSGTNNAVSIGNATVVEADSGTHYAYVPVTLAVAPPVGTTVKVQVLAACGSAGDPGPASQNIAFRAGQRVRMIRYPIVADKNPENTEVAYKRLKGVKLGNTVVTVPRGAVTIDDNDPGTPPPDVEPPPLGDSDLISQSSDGQQAFYPPSCTGLVGSSPMGISDDGNDVLFTSSATNLVPNDTNYTLDLFVRDRVSGTTERVDLANDGSELVDGAGAGFISGDGRYVTFWTSSPDVAAPGTYQAFVRDRAAGTTTLASIYPDGSKPRFAEPSGISSDGRYVSFFAQNPDTLTTDLYLRDLATSTTRWIAPSLNGWDWAPITDNGEIAFVSSSSTLVPGDTNNYPDVFVENIATGAIERVNLTPSGAQESGNLVGPGNVNISKVAISRNGRFVEFWSASSNMGVSWPGSDEFLRDRVAGTTEKLSVLPFLYPYCFSRLEAGVSNDGRFAAFNVLCENAATNAQVEGTFFRDRVSGTTTQVDTLPDGSPANAFGAEAAMSADGKWVAYGSGASNLVPGDTNNKPDVFIRKIS